MASYFQLLGCPGSFCYRTLQREEGYALVSGRAKPRRLSSALCALSLQHCASMTTPLRYLELLGGSLQAPGVWGRYLWSQVVPDADCFVLESCARGMALQVYGGSSGPLMRIAPYTSNLYRSSVHRTDPTRST